MKLTHKDFEQLFGCDELPLSCTKLIDSCDFSYRILEDREKDKVVLDVIKALDKGFSKTGNIEKWEKGWNENYELFTQSRNDKDLVPKYYKNTPLRLLGEYIVPVSEDFETNFFDVLRTWIAEKYFTEIDIEDIYEFGCGPAHNLLAWNKMFPQKRFTGLDWAKSSQKIIKQLAIDKISGVQFDMFNPPKFCRNANSITITIGALEQLGTNFTVLDYWLNQGHSSKKYIHIEPVIEFYDDTNLLDYLAKKFTLNRNYLSGYLSHLESDKRVIIEKKQRVHFGGLFHEGWNIIVWRAI